MFTKVVIGMGLVWVVVGGLCLYALAEAHLPTFLILVHLYCMAGVAACARHLAGDDGMEPPSNP